MVHTGKYEPFEILWTRNINYVTMVVLETWIMKFHFTKYTRSTYT